MDDEFHLEALNRSLQSRAGTRRRFLRHALVGASALAAPLVVNLSGCGLRRLPIAPQSEDAVTLALLRTSDFDDEVAAARSILATVDFSWLSPGDSVFVKVSSNSANRHPAVTSPAAVTAMAETLFDLGAGRVIVGDQAGVQFVRLRPDNERYSATRIVFERNGLAAAAEAGGAELHFFDDADYETGYVEATLAPGHRWQRPMMIPRIVTEVDHIVVLPRLSAHVLSGYTLGLKSAVGFLRDDSRHHLHYAAGDFFEKFVDVNYCEEIQSRLRLVFTYSPKMLLHMGPDSGTIVDADPAVAIISRDIAHHDVVGAALIAFFNASTVSTGGIPYGMAAGAVNTAFVDHVVPGDTGLPWEVPDSGFPSFLTAHDFAAGVRADRALVHAYLQGAGLPPRIDVQLAGEPLDVDVATFLATQSNGLLRLA